MTQGTFCPACARSWNSSVELTPRKVTHNCVSPNCGENYADCHLPHPVQTKLETSRGNWRLQNPSVHHISGALKNFSLSAFPVVFAERLGESEDSSFHHQIHSRRHPCNFRMRLENMVIFKSFRCSYFP